MGPGLELGARERRLWPKRTERHGSSVIVRAEWEWDDSRPGNQKGLSTTPLGGPRQLTPLTHKMRGYTRLGSVPSHFCPSRNLRM